MSSEKETLLTKKNTSRNSFFYFKNCYLLMFYVVYSLLPKKTLVLSNVIVSSLSDLTF